MHRPSRLVRGWLASVGFAALLCGVAGSALAAPCAGFTDLDDTNPFCPNAQWLKNRAITLGCTATAYCPDDSVTRLAMAAFLNRLGTAMTPVQLRVDAPSGALDLDTAPVACQTAAFAVTGFPRRAVVDGLLAATAPAEVGVTVEGVVSLDGGANWTPLGTNPIRDTIPATRWRTIPEIGHIDLTVDQSVRFGIRVQRQSGVADLADSRCQLRVLIFSRDGTSPPF